MKKFLSLVFSALICLNFTACFGTFQNNKEEKPVTTVLNVGESFIIDNLQMTVNSYEFSDYLGALDGLNKVKKGFKYCVVHVTVKNLDKKTKYTNNFSSALIFNSDYEYNSVHSSYTDFFFALGSIPALGELDCCFSYTVAEDVENQTDKPLIFEFGLNKVNTTEIVNWKLR